MADIAPTMPIVEAVEHLLRKAQDGGHTWPVLLLGSDAWAQWSEVLDKLTPEQCETLRSLQATLLHRPALGGDEIVLLPRARRYLTGWSRVGSR